jgi:hypothetical protein
MSEHVILLVNQLISARIAMSRPCVHYETIKQTAVRLLNQGVAPSVQKIREVLGTGSNSTIAEHLKIWREEYASKTIHHLPSSMPKELISAVEVLWHAASEQASNQLAAIKTDLNEQQEKVRLNIIAHEQTITNLQTSLGELCKKIEEKVNQNQLLNIELAVTQERTLQQQSEARWLKLIDQARTEASEKCKHHEVIISKQNKQIESLQTNMTELHNKHIIQATILEQSKISITDATIQFNKIQAQYNGAITSIALLEEKLHFSKKFIEK